MTTEIKKSAPPPVPPRHNKEYMRKMKSQLKSSVYHQLLQKEFLQD